MEHLNTYRQFENIFTDYIRTKSIKLFNDTLDISKQAFKFAKREGRENYLALKILNKMIKGKDVSDKEKLFFKHQARDLMKLLPIIAIQGLPGGSVAITPILYKIEDKYNISIFPKENEHILKEFKDYLSSIS